MGILVGGLKLICHLERDLDFEDALFWTSVVLAADLVVLLRLLNDLVT